MSERKLPTAADKERFWALVEQAWAGLGPDVAAERAAVVAGTSDDPMAIEAHLKAFTDNLAALSDELSSAELTDVDRVVERLLYDIDREDIHAVTDGSDDGFLYCRGFIVALGREYYEAVAADPERATEDAECERMCYLFAHRHRERFDDRWPETGSGISRESFSNKDGWA